MRDAPAFANGEGWRTGLAGGAEEFDEEGVAAVGGDAEGGFVFVVAGGDVRRWGDCAYFASLAGFDSFRAACLGDCAALAGLVSGCGAG